VSEFVAKPGLLKAETDYGRQQMIENVSASDVVAFAIRKIFIRRLDLENIDKWNLVAAEARFKHCAGKPNV
jgi:hypothetical protein